MLNNPQLPAQKWWATQVTAVTGLLTAWIVADGWNQQLSIAAVTLIGQALIGYLVPNGATADNAAPAATPAVAASVAAAAAPAQPRAGLPAGG